MEKLGVGVIGCGMISGNHFHALEKLENVALRAVCDIDEEKLQKAMEAQHVDGCADWRDLISRDDIPHLLKAMDVFILPSRFEGLGIVLIEAQVSGLPCVVSDRVPEEAYQSPSITRLSLDDGTELWVEALLDPKGNIERYGDLNDYDMRRVIRELEQLYLGSV